MTVDSTSLLVALKQKPHPSDAGSGIVCESEERGAGREERGVWSEEGRGKIEEGRGESGERRGL